MTEHLVIVELLGGPLDGKRFGVPAVRDPRGQLVPDPDHQLVLQPRPVAGGHYEPAGDNPVDGVAVLRWRQGARG